MKKISINEQVYKELKYIAERVNCQEMLREYIKILKKKKERTIPQNNALHLDFTFLAKRLNEMGLDQRKVLKPAIDIPWTTESVKKNLFTPIMKAMYGKTSTTQLTKTDGEIESVRDVLFFNLGEKFGVEYYPFPHVDKKKLKESYEYPEEDAKADKF